MRVERGERKQNNGFWWRDQQKTHAQKRKHMKAARKGEDDDESERLLLLRRTRQWRAVYWQPRAYAHRVVDEDNCVNSERDLRLAAGSLSLRGLTANDHSLCEAVKLADCEPGQLQLVEPTFDVSDCARREDVVGSADARRVVINYSDARSGGSVSRRERKRQRLEARARNWEWNEPGTCFVGDGPENVVLVSSLPKVCTEDDLRALGERFGRVKEVRLVMAGHRARRRETKRQRRADIGKGVPCTHRNQSAPLHAGYGFIAYSRQRDALMMLTQYAAVRNSSSTPAQEGQFKIRKKLVVCDVERGRRAQSGSNNFFGSSGLIAVTVRQCEEPNHQQLLRFTDFIRPSLWHRSSESDLRSIEGRQRRIAAAVEEENIQFLVSEGRAPSPPFIPKSLRSVAHLCPQRKRYCAEHVCK